MFQRFFVPLDGSMRAEKAIPVAARLAHAAKGTVTLARVILPATGSEEYGANILANETRLVQAEVAAEARAYLDEVLERYDQELDGIHLVLETAPGTLPSALLKLSSQEHSDLIVMCSRGDTWLKRWVFGSVAQATFRKSPIPVLVLSEHDETFSLEDRPLRILMPLDGSELAETALEPVFQMLSLVAAPESHEIHLLQVIAVPPATGRFRSGAYITDALQKEERQAAEHALQTLTQRLSLKAGTAHCIITTSVVISPDVAGAIVEQAKSVTHSDPDQPTRPYDLIALATHGRTGFKRAMLGSVTEHVFGATTLPLLITCPHIAQSVKETAEAEKKDETSQSWVGLL
jgi:nucleotide-binding universal stress UspA family protein